MEERRLGSILWALAGRSTPSTVLLTLLFFIILSVPVVAVAGITEEELETAIDALRLKGYDLFANAIETSDLQYELLEGGDSFTFFAPTDSSLYYLDLESRASDYIQNLRFHISPHRLSISDLGIVSMSQVPYIGSLVPNHVLFIAINHTTETNLSAPLIVDGVQISIPNLYVGPGITIHGLDGILDVRFQAGASVSGDPISLRPAMSPSPTLDSDFFCPVPSPTIQDLITPACSPAPSIQDLETMSSSPSPTMQDLTMSASSPSPTMQDLITSSSSQLPPMQDLTTPGSFPAPGSVTSRFRKHGKHNEHRRRKKRHGKKVSDEYQNKKDAVTGSDRGGSNFSSLYARV
ncbi:fasciclin-like arabinogalactan protein 19 [Macadamia integrifolia]|uniref:fasciclin-like arabinogalactan protein 19 n=1 Tax=Macadamia integrifolia TaxID=60698 RepID=UPI001C4EB917|nr:fasciclin-like arabinogalactan protein 19 [Macadamia integrifolia]